MDPNQPTSSTSPIAALLNNKKLLIIMAAVIIIVGLGIILLSPKSTNRPGPGNIGNNNTEDGNTIIISGVPVSRPPITQSPTIVEILPEDVAIELYRWYVNHPAPLKSGEYQTRRDITDKYKKIMNGYVRRGLSTTRDDVFNCGQTKANLPRNVVPKNAEYDQGRSMALVKIHNADTGLDEFILKMEKVEGEWKLRDVWCAPLP